MKYTVSNLLLKNIKGIVEKIASLNHHKLSKIQLATFEQSAVVTSSYSSTAIEGNPLPITDVKKIIKNRPENLKQTEIEVLNYNDTLMWLNGELKSNKLQFNQKLILEVHKKVMNKLLIKTKVGTLRNEPVFVNDPRLRKTIYWPPDHQDLSKLMKALEGYILLNQKEIDPIILAGLFHKQFVIIHPFIDGNGRTVRLLTKALLAKMGLNIFHLFSFENYYNNNVSLYFQKVGIRGNYYDLIEKIDFTEWLEYFSAGILDELLRVEREINTAITGPETMLQEDQKMIINYIQEHGFIRDSEYAKITKRAKATRVLDFNKLLDLGLIEKFGKGRATYYKLK